MAKEFFMLIGPPGSGKSTWIAKNNLDGKFVASTDDILEEIAKAEGITYSQAFDKAIAYANKEMLRRVKEARDADRNVIWDQTNMTVKARASKLQMFRGYVRTAVVFVVDDAELARRLDHRAATTGKVIPEFVVRNMQKSYVAPSKDEGFDKIIYVR